jgi:sodium/bile acid cotransporter 7
MSRLSIVYDRFLLIMLATIALAMALPASGAVAETLHAVSTLAIALLFFLHGARLPREAIIAGLAHWRLHLLVLAVTFVFFPLLGAGLKLVLPSRWIGPELMLGVLFLCALPSTVQSSIAFTAIAHGNVAAAVCSASLSNLVGVFLTPVLATALMSGGGEVTVSVDSILRIILQLALPFVAGHLARPWLARWLERRRNLLAWTDRGTVLLVVYLAISASVIEGLWRMLPWASLAVLFAIVSAILATALLFTHRLSLASRIQARGPHCHRVLRLQEEPGQRHPDCQCAVCRQPGTRHDRAAGVDLPPDPADRLRGDCAALCAGPALILALQRDPNLRSYFRLRVILAQTDAHAVRSTSSTPNPVLDSQARHAHELVHVVGDQGQACAARMTGNMQIVHAYRLPACFKLGAYASVVLRCLGVIGQHFHAAAKVFNGRQVVADLAAFLCAVQQLCQSDRGNGHAVGVGVERTKHFDGTALEHVNDDVGVKQIAQHSQHRPIRLRLAGTFDQEILADLGAIVKEAVPGIVQRSNDALGTARPYPHLAHTFGQAQLGWQSHRLSAIVGEHGGGGHGFASLE